MILDWRSPDKNNSDYCNCKWNSSSKSSNFKVELCLMNHLHFL